MNEMLKRNIKAVVEYDGINFNGFQKQKNQEKSKTVQSEIEKAIKIIFKEDIKISASGRTDAKVHALGQVISFEGNTNLNEYKILTGLNAILPNDIVIKDIEFVDDKFDARKSSHKKTYIYIINNGNTYSALNKNRELFYREKLDIGKMILASQKLIGIHDYAGFTSKKGGKLNTVRNIYNIEIEKYGDRIVIKLTANGFLYNMVRIIVATLIEIGNGKKEIDIIDEILKTGNRTLAGKRLEPYGLYLLNVEY